MDNVREREHFVDKLAIAEYKASDMGDKSVTKVSAATAPRGPMGQKYLASGIRLSIGREAEAVIFVLGAPSPSQTGARGWAGSHPNLLNVAVTRAKEALYVIGNRDLWCGAGLFRELDHRLPLWPPVPRVFSEVGCALEGRGFFPGRSRRHRLRCTHRLVRHKLVADSRPIRLLRSSKKVPK
jgi:hypothetical protein